LRRRVRSRHATRCGVNSGSSKGFHLLRFASSCTSTILFPQEVQGLYEDLNLPRSTSFRSLPAGLRFFAEARRRWSSRFSIFSTAAATRSPYSEPVRTATLAVFGRPSRLECLGLINSLPHGRAGGFSQFPFLISPLLIAFLLSGVCCRDALLCHPVQTSDTATFLSLPQ